MAKKLFETTDLKVIENLIESNRFYQIFRADYGHSFNKISVALKYYCDFLKSKAENAKTDFTSTSKANLEQKSDTSKKIVVAVKSESAETTERILSNKKAFKELLKVKYFSESTALKYLTFSRYNQ